MLSWDPHLLADLNTLGQGSVPQSFASFGEQVLFVADDGTHGQELWRTDGMHAELVKDIRPGTVGAILPQFAGQQVLFPVGDQLLFLADDGQHGRELWATDGTESGTLLVWESLPGTGSTMSSLYSDGANVYFNVFGTGGKSDLWASDGTTAGTRSLAMLSRQAFDFVSWRDGIAFTSDSQLWGSDGTVVGTQALMELPPLKNPNLTVLGDQLVIYGEDAVAAGSPSVLYISDGTSTGTQQIWSNSADIRQIASAPSALYFTTDTSLWRSDGSEAGTSLVTELPGGGPPASEPLELLPIGSLVYFTWSEAEHGLELWISDGTAAGTERLSDFAAGATSSHVRKLTEFGGQLYFYAADDDAGVELAVSDGTPQGTEIVSSIDGPANSLAQLSAVEDELFLSVGFATLSGQELWTSDGTADGTMLLADIRPGTLDSSDATAFIDYTQPRYDIVAGGDRALLLAKGWKTSALWGYESGSENVGRLSPDLMPYTVTRPTYVPSLGKVLLGAASAAGPAVAASDGTPSGTLVLTAGAPYSRDGIPFVAEANGRAYFINAAGLWRSDGTAAGTEIVLDLEASELYATWTPVALGDDVYFLVLNLASGQNELWRTSATTPTPALVELGDVEPISHLTVSGDQLFFIGESAAFGQEVWVTDGTAVGTHMVADTPYGLGIRGDEREEEFWRFIPFDEGVVFAARSSQRDFADVWFSDGSTAGTYPLGFTVPLEESLRSALVHDGVFYTFHSAMDGTYDYLITASDGTPDGTHDLKRLPDQFGPAYMTLGPQPISTPDLMFFQLYVAGQGWTLWQSDGTAEGTRQSVDPLPDSDDLQGWMKSLTYVDGRLLVTAPDPLVGREPFVMDLTVNHAPVALPGTNYVAAPGAAMSLDASATYDLNGNKDPLQFRWDLDGDGQFGETGEAAQRGDEVGSQPTFSSAGLEGVRWTVQLQVDDSRGGETVASTNVLVPLRGDANLDGQVTGADYTVWADHFGQTGVGFAKGDFNGDGTVDESDLAQWIAGYGTKANYDESEGAVPSKTGAILAPARSPIVESSHVAAIARRATESNAVLRKPKAAIDHVFDATNQWRLSLD